PSRPGRQRLRLFAQLSSFFSKALFEGRGLYGKTAIFHAQFLSSFRRLVIPRSEPGFADFFPSWFPPLTPSTSAVKAAPPRGWVWGGGVYPRERKSRMTLRRAQNNAPAPRPFRRGDNFYTPCTATVSAPTDRPAAR